MFAGCLEFCRTFIGVQPMPRGCSLAELGDFICEDLLPCQGLAANADLRNTIVRLLITSHSNEFSLCREESTDASPGPAGKQTSSSSLERVARKKKDTAASASAAVEGDATRSPLTAAQAVELLDAGRVSWTSALPTSSDGISASRQHVGSSSNDAASAVVYLVPSVELRERVMGFRIRNEKQENVACFLAESAVQGWLSVSGAAEVKARYKAHLVVGGISALRRLHKIRMYFMLRTTTQEVVYRYFPHFAPPLTEAEKAELPQLMTAAGASSCSAEASGEEEQLAVSVVRRRQCRRWQPLHHYYARLRDKDAMFPSVVFDLQRIRQAVLRSPERRLLLKDAVHAIFTSHGIPLSLSEDLGRVERRSMRVMLNYAGLRVVRATLVLHARRRELLLVMPAEDLVATAPRRQLSGTTTAGAGAVAMHSHKRARSDSEESDGREAGEEKATDLSNAALASAGYTLEVGGGDLSGEDDADDGDDGNGDDEESPPPLQQQQQPGSTPDASLSNPAARVTTRHRQAEACVVMLVDAAQPVEAQAAQEAERRPLSLTAVVPRLRFQIAANRSSESYGEYLTKYAKLRGTIERQHLLLMNTRTFTAVFAPSLTLMSSQSIASQVDGAQLESAATDAEGRFTSTVSGTTGDTAVAAAASEQTSTLTGDPLHYTEKDPRLPKGLSAYAVNAVLDVLVNAAPHHAATFSRLASVLESSCLRRRVLPFLRQHNLVYTTGFSQRWVARAGLVVLRRPGDASENVLDDEAKRAVVEAESKQSFALPPPPPPTSSEVRSIRSCIVLASLPAVAANGALSQAATSVLQSNLRGVKAVNSVMAVRNGYARSALQRVSRLHLELWHQHCLYDNAATAWESGVKVIEMVDRMTLSTYCVVVGVPQGDLAGVLSSIGGGDGASESTGWSTPVKELPPSLYGWCQQQGLRMLSMCLSALQDRQLVRSSDNFQHLLMSDKKAEVRYALCPFASADGHTYTFVSSPPSTAASLYACMRYWLPQWSEMRPVEPTVAAQLLEVEPNPCTMQVVALARVLHRESGAMAAQLYQSCGVLRGVGTGERRSSLLDLYRGRGGAAQPSRRGSTRVRRLDTLADDDVSGDEAPSLSSSTAAGRKRPAATPLQQNAFMLHKMPRTEVCGAAVADALEHAFHHEAPLQRLQKVEFIVHRARDQQLLQHALLTVPPLLDAVLRPGVDAVPALAAAAAAAAPTVGVCPTEFNTSGAGQGGSAYNRTLSVSLLHMGALSETLRVVRHAQERSRHSSSSGGPSQLREADAVSSNSLKDVVESVFAPNAELPAGSPPSSLSAASASFFAAEVREREATCTATRTQQQKQARAAAAEFEIVADILRMVLFSDHAHYRATIARSLLTALSADVLVGRARSFLQRLPAFTRTPRNAVRIPHLFLTPHLYVLPSSALKGSPQACANVAVLHRLSQTMENVGQVLTSGQARLQMEGMETATVHGLLNGSEVSAFPPALQLEHQPTMDVAQMAMAPNVVSEAMTNLPLPSLTWPEEAVTGERKGLSSFNDGDTRLRKPAEKPQWQSKLARRAAATTTAATTAAADDGGSSGSDAEDEKVLNKVEMTAVRRLYPARCIRNIGDVAYLRDLPSDPPPTPAEQRAVEACRRALSQGRAADLSTDVVASPCHITYPSIFHHVDGSFHRFMWLVVVNVVYRYVLRVPGICHADLEGRLMVSGLLSQRAVRAVLLFLLDRKLMVCREEEMSDGCTAPGGGIGGPAPRPPGPFSRRGTAAASTEGVAQAQWSRLERCCYTAIAPLEAVELALSAAEW